MSQVYSNPKRESDPYALPDIETFQGESGYLGYTGEWELQPDKWYYWTCVPGCLPDSDPIGPFDTEQQAIDDAQSDAW